MASPSATAAQHQWPGLSLIWAQARGGVIGYQGGMPWQLPEDLAHLKRTTMGAPVIMGRATWLSLPPSVRPLPGRFNIVLSRDPAAHFEGAPCAHSLADARALCEAAGFDSTAPAWVIGGAQPFALATAFAHRAVITHIDADPPGDTFAPALGPGWVERDSTAAISRTGLSYRIVRMVNTAPLGLPAPPSPEIYK